MNIRLRACLAVVREGRILLVPHFNTDAGAVQWQIPGGTVEGGESLQAAAREFREETGYDGVCGELPGLWENIQPRWHSITIAFRGQITGGELVTRQTAYGEKRAQWFLAHELTVYYPPALVEKALHGH